MTTATQYSPDYWNGHVVDDPDERDAIERAMTKLSPTLIAFAERALAEAAIAPGSTVIDVGTQFGTVAVVLARAGMRILATDVSADMIERISSYGIGAIQACKMDGHAMAIPEASFDAAVTMFGVTLFDDWRAGLEEIHRVVRPGGPAVVGTWTSLGGAGAVRALYLLCEELFPETPPPELPAGVVEMQSPERFAHAMNDAGFVDVRVVYEDQVGEIHPHDLDQPDEIFSYSTQWSLLDPAQQRTIVDVMRERFTDRGTYSVTSTAGIAIGHRSS